MQERLQLYLIHWQDSRQPRGTWQHVHDVEVEGPVKITSVGWLIESNPEVYLLAPNVGDTDNTPQVSGVIEIPRANAGPVSTITDRLCRSKRQRVLRRVSPTARSQTRSQRNERNWPDP